MTPDGSSASQARPVLFGAVSSARSIARRRGGGGRVDFRNVEQRIARLDTRFDEVMASFGQEVQLAASLQAADPQLVLVFEALDEQIDLAQAARSLGMEVLFETEDAVEQSEEFVLTAAKPRSPLIGSCLHAICLNQAAFNRLRNLWTNWKRDRRVPQGYTPIRELFSHLRDVRPWGPQDRLKLIDWEQYFEGQITDRPHAIEVELWYRGTDRARAEAQRATTVLIERAGGQILTSADIQQIGYHAIKCTVPTDTLISLVRGRFEDVQLVRSSNVMYLRITGQTVPLEGNEVEHGVLVNSEPPQLPPIACLLDGVPAVNQPLLAGRVEIFDPDDLQSDYTVEDRKHGTWMASVVVWGDRSGSQQSSQRKVLVRPILAPSVETANRVEELPPVELVPDLMWRVFRELFESREGAEPVAPQIAIVNLSVGDPASPFESLLSSWARMMDWLSYKYGVLVIIAAGNHGQLSLDSLDSHTFANLVGDDRRQALLRSQNRVRHSRRLLAPAEAINALAIGAVHADMSEVQPVGYVLDPTDGLPSISPITALGTGYRRSVKPDVAANGGRVLSRQSESPEPSITFSMGLTRGPGIKVASVTAGRETFIAGTSPAAALVTRQATRLYDLVEQITDGVALTRRQRAVAIKALLIHGSGHLDDFGTRELPLECAFENGVLRRDLSEGCASNEAVVLFIGTIGATQEQDLLLPLPDGLTTREVKRIEATLAWLSPVNWRHRQYRRANLTLVKPAGAIPALGTAVGLSTDTVTRGATTVQHQVWETRSAFAAGKGSTINVRIKCYEQAGGLAGETIDYAAALSLWVAPTVNVDVYSQVRDQIRPRIQVMPE
jgi:hypothetical protein